MNDLCPYCGERYHRSDLVGHRLITASGTEEQRAECQRIVPIFELAARLNSRILREGQGWRGDPRRERFLYGVK